MRHGGLQACVVGVSPFTTVEGHDEETVLGTTELVRVTLVCADPEVASPATPLIPSLPCSVAEGAWLEDNGSCSAVEGSVRLCSSCPCEFGATSSDADCATLSGVLGATIEWKIFGFELDE